jgi:hypothetical protein
MCIYYLDIHLIDQNKINSRHNKVVKSLESEVKMALVYNLHVSFINHYFSY